MRTHIGEILIISDEANSLASLTGILADAGYQVRPGDSRKLAMASVEDSQPELILLDMRMPSVDGLEVCRQLKVWEKSPKIPVLFVSGSSDAEARLKCLELGAVDFVTEPFHREELVARVRTHLELSRLRSQVARQSASPTEELHRTIEHLQREIAVRRQIEQVLRESEQRFRLMADTAPVMIATSDANQQATFFNKVWLDFTGRTMEQELGSGWIASVHPDDLENALRDFSASSLGRKECNLEYRLRRADGEYHSIMCKGVPRFHPDGEFAGYIASMVDISKLKGNQRALEQYQRQLRELTVGLISDRENTNRQLARELHDVLSQEIVIAGSEILALQNQLKSDGALAGRLLDIGNRLVSLGRDVHRSSYELHAAVLEDLGLKPALEVECETFRDRSGIPTRFIAKNMPAGLSRDVSLCLYRVAQESLRNIGKHAVDSSKVRVSVSGGPQRIVLRIEDNGEGFKLEDAGNKGGLGLIGMKERVRMVNGSFSLRSEPGKGSTVEVVVPIS